MTGHVATGSNSIARCSAWAARWTLKGVVLTSLAIAVFFTSGVVAQVKKAPPGRHAEPTKKNVHAVTDTSAGKRTDSTTSNIGGVTETDTAAPSTLPPIGDDSTTTTQGSDASTVPSQQDAPPQSTPTSNGSSVFSIRNILAVLLIAIIIISIGVYVSSRAVTKPHERLPVKTPLEVRAPPPPTISPRDLQDLREAIDLAVQKRLREFGNLLLLELAKREKSRDGDGGVGATAFESRGVAGSFSGRPPSAPPRRRSIQQCIDDF